MKKVFILKVVVVESNFVQLIGIQNDRQKVGSL